LLADVAVILSALAHRGNSGASEIGRAFAQGVSQLGPAGRSVGLLAPGQCSLEAVDRSLDSLASATTAIKKCVLDACASCIAADRRVTIDEGELLRAIADALDCPMPPLLGAPGAA